MLLGTQMCWWVCVWLIDIMKISRWWRCEPPSPGETYLLNECALPSLILIWHFVSSLVPFTHCHVSSKIVVVEIPLWIKTWQDGHELDEVPALTSSLQCFSPQPWNRNLMLLVVNVEISMIQSLCKYFHCLYCLQFKGEIMKPHSISIQSWYCLDFWKGIKPQTLRLKVHHGILQGCCLHYDPSQHFVELEMELVMLSLNVFRSQKC